MSETTHLVLLLRPSGARPSYATMPLCSDGADVWRDAWLAAIGHPSGGDPQAIIRAGEAWTLDHPNARAYHRCMARVVPA